MENINVGSVCSGIEAASVSWMPLGYRFVWFSEISEFPSRVLMSKYPDINNLGNLCKIPDLIRNRAIITPDLICGGTPCQAFSLAGWKKGLEDDRGNLTLRFVDIIEANDAARATTGAEPSMVFWENVEGVLKDKTNAFGCMVSSLAGLNQEIELSKWPTAGIIYGPKRNVAWRLLDAKYFGLPQQRRRLYLIAGGKNFYPEHVLFEKGNNCPTAKSKNEDLVIEKDGHRLEFFRSYTDCLYAAYGTKWNGNAAAYNGSLYVVQNGRLRRFTPIECERLMGFPDDYTNLPKSKPTARYQAVGNSWAVPVVRWLGERLKNYSATYPLFIEGGFGLDESRIFNSDGALAFDLSRKQDVDYLGPVINTSDRPNSGNIGNLRDIVCINTDEAFYITPAGCKGILRRKTERSLSMNKRLEEVLTAISAQWSDEKIDKISRVQTRGRFSTVNPQVDEQIALF